MTSPRHADARLLAIASASNDAIVGAGTDGCVFFWNMAAERIFGWPEREIVGLPLTVLMPERYREAHVEGFARLVETGEGRLLGTTILIEGLRRDGAEFPMQLSLGSWEDDSGPCFTAVIRDVTELEERNRELERSNAALEQFAAIASHDLSAPLLTIHGHLRLLQRRHAEELSADAQEFVTQAVHAAQRMQRLIDDLLIYARVGQGDPIPGSVDTAAVVANVVEALDPRGTVTWGALPTVEGLPSELEQLFQNLIGNAVKFVPADRAPRVELTAERADGMWRFCVDDNGIGLHPDDAELMFDAFQRGVGGEDYEGTGVGLAIARKVVEHHGGRIWVDPKTGDGTRFCFTLPA
jgi:PAS domain S-box-containing protein